MSKFWRRSIILFVLALCSCFLGVITKSSFTHIIWVIVTVISSLLFICFLSIAIIKQIKKESSAYKIFAWTDAVIGILTIIYAIYDILTDTGWFAGILGYMLLVYVLPIIILLLIIDYVIYIRNRAG